MSPHKPVVGAVYLLTVLALSGCAQINYYSQSVIGHSRLMLARQSIEKAITNAEKSGDQSLAGTLRVSQSMRDFSITELALPDNKSYRSYVPLNRKYPVWTVVAAPEFSVQAKQWCYPVIGCASYRGFFSESDAKRFAEKLNEKGYETTVGGALAYSTLGWFNDPLLPSMFRDGEGYLADTLFHELAHQVLYVNDNSEFNEAFATVVGERGAQLWLSQNNSALLAEYNQRRKAYRDFANLLLTTRSQLQELYDSELSADQKRQKKEQSFQMLRVRYDQLKRSKWQGKDWFGRWFERPLNNARLTAVATYYEQVPALNSLLQTCADNFQRFYQILKRNSKTKPLVTPNEC